MLTADVVVRLLTMTLPNFIVIGAPRAGTTALHHWLGQHPDVCVSRPKETQFFSLHFERGTVFYEGFFQHHRNEPAVGESTPMYMALPHVPRRIARMIPDVALIAILRDPVAQAFSSWWMMRGLGVERRPFAQAVAAELSAAPLTDHESEAYWSAQDAAAASGTPSQDCRYLMLGHYAEALRRYLEFFDPSQLTVLLHDDLAHDPAAALATVCSAVAVDPARAATAAPPKVNAGRGRAEAWTRRRVRALPSARLRAAVVQAAQRLDRRPPPALDHALAQELREHFAGANEGLPELLGRDIPWAVPKAAQR